MLHLRLLQDVAQLVHGLMPHPVERENVDNNIDKDNDNDNEVQVTMTTMTTTTTDNDNDNIVHFEGKHVDSEVQITCQET